MSINRNGVGRLHRQVRAAIAGSVLVAAAPGAMAATIMVDSGGDMSGGDGCTLRSAIMAANDNATVGGCAAGDDNNDTIVFADGVAGGTIMLAGEALPTIEGGSTLTIGAADGDGGDSDEDADGVTIDANGQSRIFTNQGQLTLNHLVLINGMTAGGDAGADDRSGGAILNDDGGVLTVNGGAMRDNTADRAGGAIEEASGVSIDDDDDDDSLDNVRVTLNGVEFSGNDAGMNPGNGGALHVTGGGDIRIDGGAFSDNIAVEGGALWNNGGTMHVDGVAFSGNTATGPAADQGGGAIYAESNGGTLIIDDSRFVENRAGADDSDQMDGADSASSGGAILASSGTTLRVHDSSFRMNAARRAGGAIEVLAGTDTMLDNVTATGNDAGMNPGNGGVVHVTGDGDVDVDGGIFARNTAVEGGAFWNNQGDMHFDGVSIVNNEATGDGADQGGGGIFAEAEANEGEGSGMVTIRNSRIATNRATGDAGSGGALLVSPGATAEITDSRIEGNRANRAGAGIEVADGTVTMLRVTLGGASSALGNAIDPSANPGNGGGLHIGGAGSVTIERSSVGYNSAVEGGGLWNSGAGTLDLDNVTVSNNSADTGAGVYLDGAGGSITLDYVTVTDNAGTGVDAAEEAGGSIAIRNSLISGNDTDLGSGIAAEADDGNVTGDVALDGAYRLFGGTTPTQPLATGSAALDSNADCDDMDVDQRGADRGFDAGDSDAGDCDAGAFELTDDPVLTATAVDLDDVVIEADDEADSVAVLGVTLSNDSDDSVNVGGFSGYLERDDMLPEDVDPADLDLTVYVDGNDNGRFDAGGDMAVGSGSVADNGTTFSVTFADGAGVSIPANDSVTYLLVADDGDDDADSEAMIGLMDLGGSGTNAGVLYAGGALLGLVGLLSVGGMRRRTQLLLVVAVIALTLTACSDSDGDGVDLGQPGDNGDMNDDMDDDVMGMGQLRFVLQSLDTTDGADETDLVVGDGLPVRGATVAFEVEQSASASDDMR
ncbi:hypothetical protein SAOR_03965 [Salinisphaera orenii MK-B5]|uniref:Right handed beta helix domain-containing protein n=1 Tax=Salinisphaera orenii MK-B5 TaxID=856730 RepID=A0A423PUI9_9GAMM|nr:right-handed parallel beta-helix repeat-containing protein [Salinisphaera orenii]ROO29276.1 hypothetical protein SAOR_03965 [Salinisphaera orenii MK-B5]